MSSTQTITPTPSRDNRVMAWVLLEILIALGVLLFMVWWVMFAGRKRGERDDER